LLVALAMPTPDSEIDVVLDYHSRTKHHLHRFAASSGYLDWESQPDPFRTFEGAKAVDLPLSARRISSVPYSELYSTRSTAVATVDRDSVGALFELALGLSAWKQFEQTRWSLRCNPSSGNLHPTEGYAIVPAVQGLEAGVYHYSPRDHRLEWRCVPEREGVGRLASMLPGAILIGLSSIHWREAWKYGERAFRYCQHDIGHAIATVRYAAAAMGWKATLLDVSDAAIADVLGLSREQDFSGIDEADREHPAALMLVGPGSPVEVDIPALRDVVSSGAWAGRPNALSPNHTRWRAIDVVAEATWRKEAISLPGPLVDEPTVLAGRDPSGPGLLAADIILQRRSAVALDDSTSIPAETFYRMLDRLLPRTHVAPWDVVPWQPHLHCGIFVHRIEGLASGLYLFMRNRDSHESVKAALDPSFLFEHPEGCPEHLPLFRLTGGDFRQQAQVVSCRQKIAGAGAFSLGMIAEFRESLRSIGPWWYRKLFWEAGVLGQVLYLEAEAAGVRGTGIGCYFDDAFHGILGLRDNQLQSLYHFTIGGAVEDTRLMTLPPYAHLNARSR
jgi:SagB-type dehydrogenase family enzyme